MTTPNSTIRKLAEITDSAVFERLATDVLRSSKPSLYEFLSHPGVNHDGKTVKAPLDGIGWVRDTSGDRVVAAAHSTDKQSDIQKKWLHNPATVKVRKSGSKPTAPEGDLRKAIREISAFRTNQPSLQATLALTSNKEPDKESIVAAQQLATNARVDLEIWSASKIAQFLDSPQGQWIRKMYLGDPVEFVSLELLQSCTQRRLLEYRHLLDSEELVDRNSSVAQSTGHALLVGPSGVGKTSIALQILKSHAQKGGIGLVIPHETITLATNLAEAIDIELRKIEPALQPNAGYQTLSFASDILPFVVVIEDANAATDPPTILNKLVSWTLPDKQAGKDSKDNKWRLVCPIWPRYVDSLKQKFKNPHVSMWHSVDVYTDAQALEALLKRSEVVKFNLLPAMASSIAKALGNDPLLIALCDFSSMPDASMVVEKYVERELANVASNSADLHQSDIKEALNTLVRYMLTHKKLNPCLREIKDWLHQERDQLNILRLVFKAGNVLRLVSRDGEDILTPRHDRVLISLFSQIISHDLIIGKFGEDYLSDPFFVEAVGAAIARTQLDENKFNWLKQRNPLSIFHAFQLATRTSSQKLQDITKVASEWLVDKESHGDRFNSIRFRALQILAETDAPEVLTLTDLFPDKNHYWSWYQARFRNGDISAGLRMLTMYDSLGVTIQGKTELLDHIFLRFESKIIASLQKLLTTQHLNNRNRKGCLLLAGYLGNQALSTAIHDSWMCDDKSDQNLAAYLLASARCFDNNKLNTLELVCNAWAELTDNNDFNLSRSSFAANGISWEFRRYLPHAAIPYFVQRANTDERLAWPITYMMRDFDHPLAVEHVARFLAERDRNRQPDMFDFSHIALLDGWERQQREHDIRMSVASKTKLIELALNLANDLPLRKSAFKVWEASQSTEDINQIRHIDKTSELYEKAIWARARRGDKTVIPELIDLLPKNPCYWWQAGRYLWSSEMTEALHLSLKELANNRDTNIEWILSERLMELDQQSGEQILLQEWDNLKNSPRFVQAALYFATPRLAKLANEAITQANDPVDTLNFVTMHMGYKTYGRNGITHFEQVRLLCEYANLLSEDDIYALWEICNKRGWTEFRKTHLDEKLAQTEHFGKRFSNTIDFSDLDKANDGKVIGATSFWIERHIEKGILLPELMDGLFDWLLKHRTVKALEVIADIFYTSARRCDVERLQRHTETWPEAEELIADLLFSVQYRMLN